MTKSGIPVKSGLGVGRQVYELAYDFHEPRYVREARAEAARLRARRLRYLRAAVWCLVGTAVAVAIAAWLGWRL